MWVCRFHYVTVAVRVRFGTASAPGCDAQKPPFKFLHDVVTEVQRKTGFAPGLYTDAELDRDSIQDKDGKVSFLRKIIQVSRGHAPFNRAPRAPPAVPIQHTTGMLHRRSCPSRPRSPCPPIR